MATSSLQPNHGYRVVDVFAAGIALCLGLAYLAVRAGFTNQSALVLKTVGMSWLLLFLPHGVHWARRGRRHDALVTLIGLAALVLLSRIPVDLSLPLALAGIVLAGSGSWQWIRRTRPLQGLLFAALIALFSVWLAATIWEGHTTTPLMVEGLAVNRIDNDPLFHASITNMLAAYGIPTTGLDGIPRIGYHYGSHWLFAQLMQLLNTSALAFYALGFPVIFLPLLFKALLTFALAVQRVVSREGTDRLPRGFWLVFLSATVGFLPRQIDTGILIQDRVFYSESYAVSLALMFFGLALLLDLRESLPSLQKAAVVVGVPLFAAALGFTKVSVMLVLIAAGLYLLWRLRWFRRPLWLLTAVLTVLAAALVFPLVNPGGGAVSPFYQIMTGLNPQFILLWMVFGYFWLWLLIAIRLYLLRIRTIADLRAAWRDRRLLDVEAVVVMAVVGLIPGNIIAISGGSAFYFSDVWRWLAVALVLAYLPQLEKQLPDIWTPALRFSPEIPLARVAVTFAFLLWLLMFLQNVATPVPNMVSYTRATRALLQDAPPNGSELLASLEALAALPDDVKREALLFVPLSNDDYWGLLEPCYYVPFVGPAVTGMAMLEGLPKQDCPLNDFLFSFYERPPDDARLMEGDSTRICIEARECGFEQVIVLTSQEVGGTTLDCRDH